MKLIVNMGSVHEPLLDSSSLLQSGRFFTVGFYMRSVLDVQLLYYFVFVFFFSQERVAHVNFSIEK